MQKFIELLRKGTSEDRDAAIECLRTSLAPCALDAYPVLNPLFPNKLQAFRCLLFWLGQNARGRRYGQLQTFGQSQQRGD